MDKVTQPPGTGQEPVPTESCSKSNCFTCKGDPENPLTESNSHEISHTHTHIQPRGTHLAIPCRNRALSHAPPHDQKRGVVCIREYKYFSLFVTWRLCAWCCKCRGSPPRRGTRTPAGKCARSRPVLGRAVRSICNTHPQVPIKGDGRIVLDVMVGRTPASSANQDDLLCANPSLGMMNDEKRNTCW